MLQGIFTIRENRKIARDVYRMELAGDVSAVTNPGQFVNIKLDGFFLRRPISVCDRTEDSFVIVYKVVGEGTKKMAEMAAGEALDVLTGLGNGFSVEKSADRPLLAAGGMGAAPMVWLAKELLKAGKTPVCALGFQSKEDVCLDEELAALGCEVKVATVDGTKGQKGFVTGVFGDLSFDCLYACGPEPMLKAVYDATDCPAEFSFEERMGCGFGACVGCTCKTKYGNKRICREGPVLVREEIIW